MFSGTEIGFRGMKINSGISRINKMRAAGCRPYGQALTSARIRLIKGEFSTAEKTKKVYRNVAVNTNS